MGYYMYQRDNDFEIRKEDVQKAWDSLRNLFMKEVKSIHDPSGWHYSWINTSDVLKSDSFEDAMSNARWDIDYDAFGNVSSIWFGGEKYGGDEEIILDSIAPYVTDGSYIEMVGEEGEMWRWVFRNGNVEEILPTIIWD